MARTNIYENCDGFLFLSAARVCAIPREHFDFPVLDYGDIDASFAVKICEEHEEYSECSGDPTCQKTCENMDHWKTMLCTRTKVCIRGCVCEDGYVRDDHNGVCVRENSCPRVRH